MKVIATQPKPAYNARPVCAPDQVDRRVIEQKEFFKRVPLLAGLAEAELEALVKDFSRRQFRQGEAIIQQGDPGQVLYLIEAGQVRVYVQDETGQETSVNLCGPGDIFGELAVIDDMPRSANVVALEDAIVHSLGRDRFREHMFRSPRLALNFMKALSVRVRHSTGELGNLTFLDVPARLARKLLDLAQHHGVAEPKGVRINLALTQSDLASLIGTTRESINKALSTFRRQGFILMEQGDIIILDPDALRELSL